MLTGLSIAVVAALAYNLGLALQSDPLRASPPRVADAARHLLRSSWFLVGISLTTVGFFLEIVALHFQPLALVQPILAAGVLALPPAERVLHGTPIRHALVAAILAIVIGIGLVSQTVDHDATPQIPTTHAALVGVVVLGALVLPLLTPVVPARLRPVLAGVGFGGVATMMKLVAVAGIANTVWWIAVVGILVIGPAALAGEFSALRDLRPALVAPLVLAISTLVAETAAVTLLDERITHPALFALGLVPCVAGAAWVAATAAPTRDVSRPPPAC